MKLIVILALSILGHAAPADYDAHTKLRCQTQTSCDSKGSCSLEPKIYGKSIELTSGSKLAFTEEVKLEVENSKLSLRKGNSKFDIADVELDNIICDGIVEQKVTFNFSKNIFWEVRRNNNKAGCDWQLIFAKDDKKIALPNGRDSNGNLCYQSLLR